MTDRHEVDRPGFVWAFPGVVDHVEDGDSFVAHLLWAPDREGHGENVRIEGINAVELRTKLGPQARDALAALLPEGEPFTLFCRKREKYGRTMGRVIRLRDGLDVGQQMLLALAADGTHLAVPYNP